MSLNADYFDGINKKLLDSIPHSSRNILELGCAHGRLGAAYKATHPTAHWTGIDIQPQAIKFAAESLDRAILLNIDTDPLESIFGSNKFDTIVIGDLIEHLSAPERLLQQLISISTEDADIYVCIPNASHYSVIERLLYGDLQYDDCGLLDRTHLKLYTLQSAIKLFLDNGWVPHLVDQYISKDKSTALLDSLVNATTVAGIPVKTSKKNLLRYQFILRASKSRYNVHQDVDKSHSDGISVIVPVTKKWQYNLNIAASPGLKEIDAEVIQVHDSENAYSAFAKGRKQAHHKWILFAHQDVYIPRKAGKEILKRLALIDKVQAVSMPIGFAGIGINHESKTVPTGAVVDRGKLLQYPCQTERIISMDEFAIILHADSKLTIEKKLGWHLWATDLCLQSIRDHGTSGGITLDIPLFHNSSNDGSLCDQFEKSARILSDIYPELTEIPTLCGNIKSGIISTKSRSKILSKIKRLFSIKH